MQYVSNPALDQRNITILEGEARQIAYFPQTPKSTPVAHRVHQETAHGASNYPIKSELAKSVLRTPFPDHIFTDNDVV